MADRPSRRSILRSGIALGAVSLAGCLSLDGGGDSNGNDTETDPSDDTTDPDGNGTDDGNSTDPDDPEPEPTIDRWPQFQYDAGNTGYVDAKGPTDDVEEVWNKRLEPQITASPLLAEETLYVTDYSGTVHAFATADGAKEWTTDLGETAQRTGAIYEDLLLVPTHDAIYGLDLTEGEERWRTPNSGKATHLTLVDGTVAFANRSTTVRALDAASGEEQWTSNEPEDPIEHALAYDGEALYGHDGSNSVYRFGIEDGGAWAYASTDGEFTTTPSIRDGLFVVGGGDGAVHAYDMEAQRLSERWTYPTKNEFVCCPCITDKHVVFTEDGDMTVIRRNTGDSVWEEQTGIFAANRTVVANGTVYSKNAAGKVEGRVLSTGDLSWKKELNELVPGGPWESGYPSAVFGAGSMYTCGKSGQIRAFVESSS